MTARNSWPMPSGARGEAPFPLRWDEEKNVKQSARRAGPSTPLSIAGNAHLDLYVGCGAVGCLT
jgi:hypothetical protein